MAGRGRGGQFSAITDSLGLPRGGGLSQVGEPAPGDLIEPPPTFPKLNSRPHYPQMLPENDYMLAVMKDFVNQMKDSQFSIR